MSLVASIGEVLGFFLGARLIKAIGANCASVIILLAFAARFCGYYLITQPYLLIPIETMHFFNFGILYILIVQKADAIGKVYSLKIFLNEKKILFWIYSSTTWSFWYTSRCFYWTFIWFRYEIYRILISFKKDF